MTTDEIIAQCLLFFIAGFDTTATVLALATYQLARNPDKQDKLYEETSRLLDELKQAPNSDSDDPFKMVTYDNLAQFEYLSAVINEALRIESPGIFVERRVAKDMELSNPDGSIRFQVKQDDVIHIPVYSIQRDPKLFPEPEKFEPERFIGDTKFNKSAYLPFGSGPRNCIAKNMALLEAKLALLHLIRNYRFEICDQTKVEIKRCR